MQKQIKTAVVAILFILIASICAGCRTKTDYGVDGEAPHVMTVVDTTAGYAIYRHDETGVWYFCRDGGYGKSVCVMVNPDGTPYTEK